MEAATQCISKRNFVCCLPLIAIHFTSLFSSHSHKNKNFLVYSMYLNVMLTTYKLKLTSKVQCAVNLCCNKFDPKKINFPNILFCKILAPSWTHNLSYFRYFRTSKTTKSAFHANSPPVVRYRMSYSILAVPESFIVKCSSLMPEKCVNCVVGIKKFQIHYICLAPERSR